MHGTINCFRCVDIFPLKSSFLNITSRTTLNKAAVKGSPCFTSDSTFNSSADSLFSLTLVLLLIRVNSISISNFAGKLYGDKHSSILFPYTQSKACVYLTSIYQISIIFIALFKHFSNHQYVNSRFLWMKSHLTFFQLFSTVSDILLFNNKANILYALLSRVIGLQLLHFNVSPVLYIGNIIHSFHCVGSCSLAHTFKINLYSFCSKVLPTFFNQFWGYTTCTSSFVRL